jgi:hypothetical protein
MKESKDKVSCPLIDVKQRGGLVSPTSAIVSIVKIANRNVKLFHMLCL